MIGDMDERAWTPAVAELEESNPARLMRDRGFATWEEFHRWSVTDREALDAFHLLSATEGIVPALESAHALAGAIKLGRRYARAAKLPKADWMKKRKQAILVGLSGRGDKDMETARHHFPELG